MMQQNLCFIAAQLEALEETIIFKLIDRAQFKANLIIYEPGKSGFEGADAGDSLFNLRLRYHEEMDSQFGRFLVPEERPFCKNLPPPKRKVRIPNAPLHISNYDKVNLTAETKKAYLDTIPSICNSGDDKQYGSSVEHDVFALQAISRRIHYGAFFIAESKYQINPDSFQDFIDKKDSEGLNVLLTRERVEKEILVRVKQKVINAQAEINPNIRCRVDPDLILSFYLKYIIPITKKGEITYLLNRERK